ncbi:hypothetical protein QQS21_012546 [Conoideocrella luteorostrata]|uniref:Subtilisin-like serine protease protein n=1 Tax=Conoideocrella luteorostrata TaxID=1105319 RepID=A0AAJ0CAZ6_9HYPO|nr:hypothetical protein QQS21_012546 [Conoideocrella luteorostrata]
MQAPPFAPDVELYKKLSIVANPRPAIRKLPSVRTGKTSHHLPSQPQLQLDSPAIKAHIESEFLTDYLDDFSKFFILIATPRSSHISSLTHQAVRGRRVVITEDPGLHLVWYRDRVFLKPVPKYLLSYAFWAFYLHHPDSPLSPEVRDAVGRAARGFLRSYAYLIQHPSDFLAAQESQHRLIPKGVSYKEFKLFICTCLENITDDDVSPRYHYGELRLSRLNLWSQVLLRRFAYHKVASDYGTLFAEYFASLLFIFAGFSVVLSAMQVAITAQPILGLGGLWVKLVQVSLWFSVVVIHITAAAVLFLLLKFIALGLREVIFATKTSWKKERRRRKASAKEQP